MSHFYTFEIIIREGGQLVWHTMKIENMKPILYQWLNLVNDDLENVEK